MAMRPRLPRTSAASETQYTTRGLARKLVELGAGENEDEVFRVIKHYTNQGLLNTVGAVHTGTGKNRVYPETALIESAVMLRLNQLGIPVGVISTLFRGLRRHLAEHAPRQTLLQAAQELEDPCVFFVIPAGGRRTLHNAARLFPFSRIDKDLPEELDVVMIRLARFL